MKDLGFLILLSAGVFFCSCARAEFDEPDVVRLTDSSGLPDPFMGDWSGKWVASDGAESAVALQVLARGNGKYRVNLFKRFNSAEPPFLTIECFAEDDTLKQKRLPHGPAHWKFELNKNILTGKASSGATFSAERAKRVSPTLGLKPPDGATILLDGTHLDHWRLLRDFNGHLHIPGFHKGNCCNYLKTRLWSDSDREALLQTAHNSMMTFRLNGELVYKNKLHIAPVRLGNKQNTMIGLKRGWNDLLVKIVGYNVTSAAIRIVSLEGKPLAGIAERDPSAGADGKTREYLEEADQHLTVWRHSGHYYLEGKKMDDAFGHRFLPEREPSEAMWKPLNVSLKDDDQWPMHHRLVDGAMEIHRSGDVMTKRVFADYYLHVEFRIPFDPEKTGQHRGNSGVYLACMYEIQVLDSYGLAPTKQDCGAAYYIKPPDVNMSLPPLQWQTYDIFYTAPKFNKDGKKSGNARATVYHNGVKIQDAVEFPKPTGGGMRFEMPRAPIHLQNHGAAVRYRNIWLVEK